MEEKDPNYYAQFFGRKFGIKEYMDKVYRLKTKELVVDDSGKYIKVAYKDIEEKEDAILSRNK